MVRVCLEAENDGAVWTFLDFRVANFAAPSVISRLNSTDIFLRSRER